LQQQINELNQLTHQVSIYLPEEWRDACQIVRFDTQEQLLVISTVEQSLLTPLRYLQHQLIAQLKKHKNFAMLQSIKCIYTPTHTASTHLRAPIQTKDAAKVCQAAAAYCPPELKAALEKLGETLAATKKPRNTP
jgi:hypothetical protein